ncbi:hypothetical protein [Pseudotenacibaculum haliotis]|uniref:LPXTG cell wall anchor domain-containing protein n=1 Tax=Pseudotenacibaculum haliotis TaxID=1862138 RepID=A0ABW5LTH0_9FLAO
MNVKVINVIIVLAVIIIAYWIYTMDYQDLSFNNNRSSYLGIASMGFLIVAMFMVKRQQKK